jgi:outer membrane protein, multidrug efflux system
MRGVGIALVCWGCAAGPDYRRPTVPMTPTFRGQSAVEAASFADLPWWQVFQDDHLVALIREALANSYDLKIAIARVDQARALAGVATDALLPTLSTNGSASYQQLFLGFSSGIPGLPNIGNPRFATYSVGGALSWEIDLFGRLRRLREAALAQVLAAEDARRGVIVSLIGEVASTYFNLLALDLQLEITRRSIESYRQTLQLFQEQLRGGVGDELQTSSEEGVLAAAAANVPTLEQQIVQTENQLSILIGRTPGPIARTSDLLSRPVPQTPPPGAPLSLLERRPDVHGAEAALVAANAQVGAAVANWFPTVSVSGSGGLQSSDVTSLFATSAVVFAVNALVNWVIPVLGGYQIKHQVDAQEGNYRAVQAQYRFTVLSALADVSNALVTIDKLRTRRAQLEDAVRARTRSVELARIRFREGVASYLDVVQAEQNLYPSELLLAETMGNQFIALATLYRALGGGWQPTH